MKKGISLITLAITIVVLIILVSIVILSFEKNSPIDSARVAALSQTEDSINSAIHNYTAKVKISTVGEYDSPEIILGLLENTNEYKIIDDEYCYINDDLTYKLLYKLDKNKVKEKLDVDLKNPTNKSDWYIDNYGKAYLVFDTKDDVISYLKEGDEILPYVSWFVKYKDYDDKLLLAISSDSDEKTNKSLITYTFTFSSIVTGFDESDITIVNGTKGEFKKLSEIQYSLTVTNEGSCNQFVSIQENACKNAKNIGNNAAVLGILVDRDGPVLQSLEVISPAPGEYLPGEVITFLATYDEDIYNNVNTKISEDLFSAITLKLRFGSGEERIATTLSADNTTIIYQYELQEEDEGNLSITEYTGSFYDELGNEGIINRTGSFDGNIVSGKIREVGSISFANASVEKEYHDAMFTNILTHVGDSIVTYTSSNESVATINSSGIVTIIRDGIITITARVENTENYKYPTKTASYTLTVKPDTTAPTISVSPASATACQNKNVTISVSDNEKGSGLATNNSYQYYLSSSSTSLSSGGSWKNYTSGTAFNIGSGLNGTYYLFVRKISDKVGNISNSDGTEVTISSVKYQRFGGYVFDNTPPNISSLSVISPASGTHNTGTEIQIKATYTESVYNSSAQQLTDATAPALYVKFGSGSNVKFELKSVSGSEVTYKHIITNSDVGQMAFVSYSGTIYDAALNSRNVTMSSMSGSSIIANKIVASISFNKSSKSEMLGYATSTNALTNTGNGTVVYSSSNTAVATVNSSTGALTLVNSGVTTITATVTDSATYTYPTKTASYSLTVNAHQHTTACNIYHTHTSSCEIRHTHSSSCGYSCGYSSGELLGYTCGMTTSTLICGKTAHTHTSSCRCSGGYPISSSGSSTYGRCPSCKTYNVYTVSLYCTNCGATAQQIYCTNCSYGNGVHTVSSHNRACGMSEHTHTSSCYHSHTSSCENRHYHSAYCGYACGYSSNQLVGYSCGKTTSTVVGYNCGY